MEDNFLIIKIKWNTKNKIGIINDYKIVEKIRKNYKIICEPIGTPSISSKQNKLLIGPYMVNKYDLFFLYENKYILIYLGLKFEIIIFFYSLFYKIFYFFFNSFIESEIYI